MSSRGWLRSAWSPLCLLGLTCSLAGCLETRATRIAATDKRAAVAVCSAWLPTTYSSRDTPETQLGVRANNAARAAYCK